MSLLDRIEKQKAPQQTANKEAAPVRTGGAVYSGGAGQLVEYTDVKNRVHAAVINMINESFEEFNKTPDEQPEFVRRAIENALIANGADIPRAVRSRFIEEVYNDIIGLGPLEPLLADPDITEIMVNGPDRVYVEVRGKIEPTDIKFRDNNHVMNVINRIVSSVGRRIDESSPMVDARLADGSRVNAVIPPVSLSGPTITIAVWACPHRVGGL